MCVGASIREFAHVNNARLELEEPFARWAQRTVNYNTSLRDTIIGERHVLTTEAPFRVETRCVWIRIRIRSRIKIRSGFRIGNRIRIRVRVRSGII